MQELLINAIGLGFILSVFIGPVFFLLLETSIQKGFRPAIWISIGALASDVLFIGISLLIVNGLLAFDVDHHIFRIIGGILFLGFGMYYLFRKPSEFRTRNLFEQYPLIKSFLINSINPSVLLFWLGAVAYGATLFPNSRPLLLSYISISIATALLLDVVKIYLSTKLRKVFSLKLISNLHKITGSILIIFGVNIIIQGYTI